jgi:LmbE family N-acetylglucosaminyl deacetylase
MILILTVALAVPAVDRARSGSFAPDTRRVLVILAHPDDETLLAPLLGPLCTGGKTACTLLVFTHGAAGDVRQAEMAAAAKFLSARLIHWNWPDVLGDFASAWPRAVDEVRNIIDAESPTIVITFDPAHGTTCHPAHRETGRIVLEAAGSNRVLLIETAAILGSDAIELFNAAPSHALEVDATESWHWLGDDAAIHASQFSPAQLSSLRNTPAARQRVWLAPASRLAGARYVAECSANVPGAVP